MLWGMQDHCHFLVHPVCSLRKFLREAGKMGRAINLLARLVGFCFGDTWTWLCTGLTPGSAQELVLAVLGAAHGMPGIESRSSSCKCPSHCNIALTSLFWRGSPKYFPVTKQLKNKNCFKELLTRSLFVLDSTRNRASEHVWRWLTLVFQTDTTCLILHFADGITLRKKEGCFGTELFFPCRWCGGGMTFYISQQTEEHESCILKTHL